MKYDFDTPISRRGTYAIKWEVGASELPMWVADMDFQTAPEIREAMQNRLAHGVFGYSGVPDEWYTAYSAWWKNRHNFELEKEWLIFCTGVVPAISSAVRKLTTVAENVLVQSPVYNIFFNSIVNNGRVPLESPLKYDGECYDVDFDDLERKLAQPQTTMMILCNPHNPIGKIWSRDTLERIGELCHKHHVVVLADEIHCDLTEPGCDYIPFASVSEKCRDNSITCIAPTKAFNLAGLQTAAIMVPNEVLRHKIDRSINTDEVAEPNVFAVTATIAAFTQGADWLDELRAYIHGNRCFARDYLQKEVPNVKMVKSEATYLLWLDCGKLRRDNALRDNAVELSHFLRTKTGLYLSEGTQYGKSGSNFLRMNIACPHETLRDGLERLKAGILEFNMM